MLSSGGINPLRRFIFLLALVLVLAAVYVLNRLTANWHYIIPVEPGQVAYIAAFDGFADEWQLYEGVLSAQVLPDGVLRLEAGSPNSGPFSAARPYFADFDLRVEAKPVQGPLDNAYGVIFRLEDNGNSSPADDSYYWFFISSDGYYQVMRVLNGVQKRLSDWIPSPAIRPGLGITNWLRVVATGDTFRFYINNQPVQLCVPDDPAGESTFTALGECVGGQMLDTLTDGSIAAGKIGLIVHAFDKRADEPGVMVDFDNLVIFGPEQA